MATNRRSTGSLLPTIVGMFHRKSRLFASVVSTTLPFSKRVCGCPRATQCSACGALRRLGRVSGGSSLHHSCCAGACRRRDGITTVVARWVVVGRASHAWMDLDHRARWPSRVARRISDGRYRSAAHRACAQRPSRAIRRRRCIPHRCRTACSPWRAGRSMGSRHRRRGFGCGRACGQLPQPPCRLRSLPTPTIHACSAGSSNALLAPLVQAWPS